MGLVGVRAVFSSKQSPQNGPSSRLLGLGSFVLGHPDPINMLVVRTSPEGRRWPQAQRLLSKLVVPTRAIEMSTAELTSQADISLRKDTPPNKIALKFSTLFVFHPEMSELNDTAWQNIDSIETTFSVFHLLKSALKLADSRTMVDNPRTARERQKKYILIESQCTTHTRQGKPKSLTHHTHRSHGCHVPGA